MSHAVIVSPDPRNAAGGVERMCVLLSGVLEADGWSVDIIGPTGEPRRWLSRIGAGYLARSFSATRAARRIEPDLLVTNGYLGISLPGKMPRVHVYHGTMVGDTRGEGGDLSGTAPGGSLAPASRRQLPGVGRRSSVCPMQPPARCVDTTGYAAMR